MLINNLLLLWFVVIIWLERVIIFFCSCFKCKRLQSILDEIDRWGFYEFNKGHKKWFIIFHKIDWRVTLFLVFIEKILKQIIVKYFEESESAKEPIKATEGSAGYDLFAAEARTLLPRSCDTVPLDLRWAIPKGFYCKGYPRSSILRKHMVTVDADLIDSDYKGIVEVLFINQSDKIFTMRSTGDRITQVVSVEQFDAKFEKVSKRDLLGTTKIVDGGFGSTGMSLIKKARKDPMSEKEEQ